MRANVEKALQGSLAHSKWLFSIVDQAMVEKAAREALSDGGLAKQLLEELKALPEKP